MARHYKQSLSDVRRGRMEQGSRPISQERDLNTPNRDLNTPNRSWTRLLVEASYS
ncbi:hypothetical protein J6590_003065 [Homalodisca vitripennis]|nr:hypothetical protein J6590_003065 [Homalodisca vitripennis]